MKSSISIILPARNEVESLPDLLHDIRNCHPEAELIVVNDGSTDQTRMVAEKFADTVINHPYSMGNGAAVKSGARAGTGEVLIFMDADGQHSPSDIDRLLETLGQDYAMVVGARSSASQASWLRRLANNFYNRLASIMTGHAVADLTSGFRAVRAGKFRQFLYLLPNGFSYPTTITMAFLRSGYPLAYIPIAAKKRRGTSKINPCKDGLRFCLIILKVGVLFSPMRLFLPISLVLFTTGILYYLYTYITAERFTNMGAVLLLAGLIIFLIGVISEQISALHYHATDKQFADESEPESNEP